MQRRVRHGEAGVADGAIHMHDGMARHATQAGLRLRRIDLIFDGLIETAVEKDGVIVAAGAPFAGLRADHGLHVFNGFAVILIVKRGEVVDGAFPLFVNIFVALAAFFRFHEE